MMCVRFVLDLCYAGAMKTSPIPRNGKKPITDLTGQRFGMLEVLGYCDQVGRAHRWVVRCDCGTTSATRGATLSCGRIKSCGCLKRLAGRKNLTTHGLTGSRSHGIWKAMKQRCYNPNASNYRHYGGRGITICARWREDFQSFYDDMGECPPGMSIDRVDPNGNYEPANCRWATQAEQVRNTRRNRYVDLDGQRVVAKDYCLAKGLSYSGFLQAAVRSR